MKANAKRRRTKPETVKVGNMAVKIYRREKAHKLKDKDGNIVTDKRGKPVKVLYPVFEVADYTTGIRKLWSFSDHDKAVDKANKVAAQSSSADAVAAGMRNKDAASFGRALELAQTHRSSPGGRCQRVRQVLRNPGNRPNDRGGALPEA